MNVLTFLLHAKRLTHLDKIDIILGLFELGYKNAYVSLMNFYSYHNNYYYRIKVVLPNVGRLHLYQTFVDVLDEQVPKIEIFYSDALSPNIITKIKDKDRFYRAMRIVYNAQKYFEQHPEYEISADIIAGMKSDKNIVEKQRKLYNQRKLGFIQSWIR